MLNINDMEEILKTLWNFQSNANEQLFVEIFGFDIGNHLWNKFIKEKRNLLNFSKLLDQENWKKLNDHLFLLTT